MEKSVLVEIEWDFEGDEDNPDWAFCMKNANFVHREACEFILHVGQDEDGSPAYWRNSIEEMRAEGCTPAFIAAYLEAKDAGAMRVMFWS
jgi:hypothetical protein